MDITNTYASLTDKDYDESFQISSRRILYYFLHILLNLENDIVNLNINKTSKKFTELTRIWCSIANLVNFNVNSYR